MQKLDFIDGIETIVLPPPTCAVYPFDQPVNVYLVRGPRGSVTLVNSGHLDTAAKLHEELRARNVEPREVTRVVATANWPDLVGGVTSFPFAELAVLVPLQRAEAVLSEGISDIQGQLRAAAKTLAEANPGIVVPDQLENFLRAFFRPVKPRRILPLREGHTVDIGGRLFQVRSAPGTFAPAAMSLFDPVDRLLFTGELMQPTHETPWVRSVQPLMETVEALFDLEPAYALPNRGPSPRPGLPALKRTSLFVNNFLSNVPFATKGATNAAEMATADLGLGSSIDVAFVAYTLGYRALIGELIRTEHMDFEGTGLLAAIGATE